MLPSKVRFGHLPSNIGIMQRLIGKEKVFIKRVPLWGNWKFPGSRPISSVKHKKGPDTPRARVCGRTAHSSLICSSGAQGYSGNKSLASGSLPWLHTCGDSIAIASLQRLFSPRVQGCCQTTTGSCARSVLFLGPLAPEAAHALVVCECSRPHICALIPEWEKGRNLGSMLHRAAAALMPLPVGATQHDQVPDHVSDR